MPSFDKNGFLIVKETHSCEYYEPVPGRLFCMQECWYCKWSDFRFEGGELSAGKSICRYPGNSEENHGKLIR